ncbi:hypothetical protein AB6A40_007932 [Gnathostoma spinigerum]|uniref:Uncharacterized protein n=1 Tax=Gnathostoma spinigerum TaxID=75299 RepID=A0ABD6EVY4_9BILA
MQDIENGSRNSASSVKELPKTQQASNFDEKLRNYSTMLIAELQKKDSMNKQLQLLDDLFDRLVMPNSSDESDIETSSVEWSTTGDSDENSDEDLVPTEISVTNPTEESDFIEALPQLNYQSNKNAIRKEYPKANSQGNYLFKHKWLWQLVIMVALLFAVITVIGVAYFVFKDY